MSNVLIIRHLPDGLRFSEKEQLLKYFGANNVWETKTKRNYLFAAFSTPEQAKSSLSRLHQLKIANRRLVVEYSEDNEPSPLAKKENENPAISKHIKDFLANLNAWSPSVDFRQPPPPHLKYKYPEPHMKVFINIVNAMIKHKPFYTQVIHIMNRMCLENPFVDNFEAEVMFKEMFMSEICSTIPQPGSEAESEISSDETDRNVQNVAVPIVKRKHLLPQTRKRAAAVLSMATLPKAKKKAHQEQVFEEVTVLEPKKISLVVAQDALSKQTDTAQVVGEIGLFQKEDKPDECLEDPSTEVEKPSITKRHLIKNRLSYRDMKVLPVFKNYHPGPPSMRLYIKNLAKSVTEQDVKQIYRRYVEELSEIEQIGFDVRVMQEGRMKEQAFVTFPSVSIAEAALNETNGYILKDKPMVVQFARAANKKTIEYTEILIYFPLHSLRLHLFYTYLLIKCKLELFDFE